MKNTDFASIYAQWESTHDESSAINRKSSCAENKAERVTVTQLKSMKVQDQLDLHLFTLEAALESTRQFLESSRRHGLHKVRIITGKGLHSPHGEAVLRPQIVNLIRNDRNVREADFNPKAVDGGSGAIIVILKSN